MAEWIRWGDIRDECKYCGVKAWQDQDGNIRCNHRFGCPVETERSSGKNRHRKSKLK